MNQTSDDRAIPPLPALPLEAWEQSKITLHMYAQIVGKIRLALMPKRNHWWHAPLYVYSRGWTTGPIPWSDFRFEIVFDLLDHELRIMTTRGERLTMPLGGSVADFHSGLFSLLATLGVHPEIKAVPYDQPFTTPFAEDREHASYDRDFVTRLARIHAWTDVVFWKFSGRFTGKTSPIHLFWHSFDLAVTRFSGRPAPPMEAANRVNREAYSHEVVSFGFWAGDTKIRYPAYYAYAHPEPSGLRETPLEPSDACWIEQNGGSLAILPYEALNTSPDPERRLLDFLESAYQAGARLGNWDIEGLTARNL